MSRKPARKLTSTERWQIIERIKSGVLYKIIADEFDIAENTVSNLRQEYFDVHLELKENAVPSSRQGSLWRRGELPRHLKPK